MQQTHTLKFILLALLFCGGITLFPPQESLAQENIECTQNVIVQVDDWLSKISDKFYGDVLAYPAIAEATNTVAQQDSTYATIEDVDLIEPGWKLCIVDVPTAEGLLGFTLDNAPTGDATPTNLTGVIKIGAAQALTGPLEAQGQSIQAGINLAVAQVNQSGLLGQGQLEVVWEDTAGSAEQAKTAFEKLISQDNVVAILGPTLSYEAMAADPVAQAAGVPVIGSSNIAEGLTGAGDFIFRTSLPESEIIAFTARQATQALEIKRVIIVYDQEHAFTNASLPVFEQAFLNEGVEVLATVPFTTSSPNFADQLARVQGSATDAIVLIALAEDAATIISQARQAGIPEDVRFIGASSFNSPAFLEAGGAAVAGTITGTAWNVNNITGSNRQFVTSFVNEYGRPPDQLAAQAYTAVGVLAAALRQADSTNPTDIRDAMAALQFVESPLGLFSFNEDRNPTHPLVLQVAQDGQFELFQ